MHLTTEGQQRWYRLVLLVLPICWSSCFSTQVAGAQLVRPRLFYNGSWHNTTWNEGKHIHSATIYIPTTKQLFILDIYKKPRVVSGDFRIKWYGEDGRERLDIVSNHAQGQCYYSGSVRGYPGSLLSISTCDGIRGSVHIGTVYHIEPVSKTPSGQHLWYSSPNGTQLSTSYEQHTHRMRRERRSDEHRAVRWPWRLGAKSRVIELYVVVGHKEHLKYKDAAVERIQRAVNHVSGLYSQLGIYVVLVGIEIWNQENKIDMEKTSLVTTLANFQQYREKHINPRFPNDNAQLITREEFSDGSNYKASPESMCTNLYSAGINVDSEDDVTTLAMILAHSLGHNLGMRHDRGDCSCPDTVCVMSSVASNFKPSHFSSCSREQLAISQEKGMDYCLHNLPKMPYGVSRCGNGFVETGEQCDCGPEEFCNNTCCNATTCMLAADATCATGSCCNQTTCQLMPADSLCRAAVGPCGLDEYCTGTSEWCPPDIHYYNGKPCESTNVSSYCYDGECRTHADQCRFLWGPTGQMAHKKCYQNLNTKGNRYGSCGYNWTATSYSHCEFHDVLCGTLQCIKETSSLAFWSELLSRGVFTGFQMANGKRHECNSVLLDVGSNDPNPSFVMDGTKCGDQKMCMKNKCVPLGELNFYPESDCWGHGVHTNIGTCLCDPGWTGEDCSQGEIDKKPSADAFPATDVDCGDPGEVPHATRWGYEYTVGSNVTYACLPGFGGPAINATLLCLPDSTWQGSKPACYADSAGVYKQHTCVLYLSTVLSLLIVHSTDAAHLFRT